MTRAAARLGAAFGRTRARVAGGGRRVVRAGPGRRFLRGRAPPRATPLHRQLVLAAVAGALQLVLQLPLGWHEHAPGVAVAAGILVALLGGVLGGAAVGAGIAALGWTLNFLLVEDAAAGALWALPAWLASGVAAGVLAATARRARGARAAAESEIETVREAAADAILRLDSSGAVVAWSRSAEALYGYGGAELSGRPAAELFAGPDAGEQARRLLDAALRGKPVVGAEAVHRWRGASLFPVAVSAAPTRGPDGRPDGAVLAVRDLGELVRATRQRRELAARHRWLTEHLPVVTYVRAADGEPLSVSPQVERLLGYTADELVREPRLFVRLVHPRDRRRVLERLARRADEVEPSGDEYRLRTRDGRTIWVRDEAATVLDAGGSPLCVQGFLVDVTAEREAASERARLRAAEARATEDADERQRKVDVVARAAAAVTASLDHRRAAEALARLLVRELADWCLVDLRDESGTLRRFVARRGESRAPLAEPEEEPGADVREVVEQQRPAVSERRLCVPLLSHGRRALGAVTLVAEAQGRTYDTRDLPWAQAVAGLLALAVERARLYEEAEARADAGRVLAYVGDGVFLLDRGGTIRLWNPAARAITGLDDDDVLGKAAADAIPGWHEIARRMPVTAAPEPARAETLPLETERGERWISISGVEFFGGTIYAFRDITELHALDELQADFIATASHELRTPLAAVYGAAQTLQRHDFALDEAGRQRFISMIVEESDRLGRIVNQILLANQLSLGRLDLATETFDARELVERVVESARTHAPPGIVLSVVADEPVSPVAADRDMVRQILVNLVQNAVNYSHEGGRVELGLEPAGGFVRFRVLDEGLGIAREEQSRIFEKFYRVDPDMTRGVGGTGLGLYICRELVERMGGRIWVESRERAGSAFSFELPGAEEGPRHPQQGSRDAAAGRRA